MKKVALLLVVLLLSLTGCNKEKDITGPNIGESSTVKEVQKLIKEGNNQKAYEVLSEAGKTASKEELVELKKFAKQIQIREYRLENYVSDKLIDASSIRYDKQGRILYDKGTVRFYVDDASDVEYYIYNDYYEGKEYYNSEDELVLVQYSVDGVLDNNDDSYSHYEYFYNKNGQIARIDIKNTDSDGVDYLQQKNYEYDQKGRLFKETTTFYTNGVMDLNSEWDMEYVYDDHDQVIESISTPSSGETVTTYFTLEYDDDNHIIKKTTKNDYVGEDTWTYEYDNVFDVVTKEINGTDAFVHYYEAVSPDSKNIGLDESALLPYSNARAYYVVDTASFPIYDSPSFYYGVVTSEASYGDKLYVYTNYHNEGSYWFLIGENQWIASTDFDLKFENNN